MTLHFLSSLTFINFNFMDFFAPLSPCLLYTPFLKQAAFHMAILPLAGLIIVLAALAAKGCNKGADVCGQIKADVGEVPNRDVYASIGQRVRILIGFTQVTSALVFSFDIPW